MINFLTSMDVQLTITIVYGLWMDSGLFVSYYRNLFHV